MLAENSCGPSSTPSHPPHADFTTPQHRAEPEDRGWLRSSPLAHRVVAEELAVAAVAELAVLLVGGGGGAGAALRAAVLVLPEPLIRLAWLRRVAAGAVGELVPFARGVPGEKGKEVRANPGAQNHPALGVGAPLDPTAQFAGCINPIPCTLLLQWRSPALALHGEH